MNFDAYTYSFDKSVDMREAEATLILCMMAVESLHGTSAVRMHGRFDFDPKKRICQIEGRSEVGRDLNQLFVGFLGREFGPCSFSVTRKSGGV